MRKPSVQGASLSEFIPQELHVSRYVVKCRGDELQAWFQLGGVVFETKMADRIDAEHKQLVSWLRQTLSGGEFGITCYRVRRALDVELEAEYDNDFSAVLAEEYHERIRRSKALCTDLLLCISFIPTMDRVTKVMLKRGGVEAEKRLQLSMVDRLEEACNATMSVLKDFEPRRMGLYEKDERVYSEILNFLSYLANGVRTELPMREAPIYQQVPLAESTFRDEFRVAALHGRRHYFAYLDMQDYPESFNTGALDALLYTKCEFIETMSFRPANIRDGRERLKRMQGFVVSADDATEDEMADFADAQAAQKLGTLVFGEFAYSLGVHGTTFDAVQEAKAEVQGIIARSEGFRVGVVDVVPMCGFLSQIPGNWKYAQRNAFLSDEAFFGMVTWHNFGGGKLRGNPWGDAVTTFLTPSKQPFFFNLHVTDQNIDATGQKVLGNTTIIGQSGSGKTVLEAFILSMLLKVKGIRMVLFDKDRGLEIFVRRVGGNYLSLEVGKPTGLNPFQLPLTPSYRTHLMELLKVCASDYGEISLEEELLLDKAINAVYQMPQHMRRLSLLLQNIPAAGVGTKLGQKLRKWAVGTDGAEKVGSMAWVFDNPRDVLSMDSNRVMAFDYTEILKNELLVSAILLHLLYRMERLINGQPFVYVMAEFWQALNNPALAAYAGDKQKTIRKQNGLGIFDTQEPADMLKSKYGDTMVQQTAIKIFMPNPEAVWDDYKRMGVTEREFHLIKSEFHSTSRKFLVKWSQGSVIGMLDLGGMPEVIDVLSGSTDNVLILQDVMAEHGTTPRQWVGPFHKAVAASRGIVEEVSVFRDRGDGMPELVSGVSLL